MKRRNTETEVRKTEIGRCHTAVFEDGGRGHEPRNQVAFLKLEKIRKWIPS